MKNKFANTKKDLFSTRGLRCEIYFSISTGTEEQMGSRMTKSAF